MPERMDVDSESRRPARLPSRLLAQIAAAAALVLVIGAFGVFNLQRLANRQTDLGATPPTTANAAVTASPFPIPTSTSVPAGAQNPPPDGSWQVLRGMSVARDQFTATLLADGKVLIAGGVADVTVAGSASADTEIFDPTTGRFARGPAMSVGRAGQTATLLRDGRVLVAGGYGQLGNRAKASVELYDPLTNEWTAGSPMTHGRAGHVAALLPDGRVLVVGGASFPAIGISPHGLAPATLPPEIYNPNTDTWSDAAMGRWDRPVDPTATVLQDGRVLVVGGQYMWNSPDVDEERSEVYDVASNRWADVRIDPRFASRQFHTATLLADGRVLVAGGSIDLEPTATAALYSPLTNSWIEVQHMSQVRCGHGAAALVSGNVLVIGGECEGKAETNGTEEFDPLTYRWYPVRGLGRSRGDAETVALQDGTVLYVGGIESYIASTSAQLFRPT